MKSLLILLVVLYCIKGNAQVMYMNDETTDVTFETHQLAGSLEGKVKNVKGSFDIDTSNLAEAYLRFALAPATFIHNENYVGPDLFKETCFDTRNNPEISLVSKSITRLKGDNYQFNGALIVKGKSRDISFPFTAVPNIGGYDLLFQFRLVKKKFELKCNFHKELIFKVRAYAKRGKKE